MTERPLLLVDVDGVLNPLVTKAPMGFETHTLAGFRVHLAARHGEWLRQLSAYYELWWASSWEEDANQLIAPLLDLPRWPTISFDVAPGGRSWKLPAVMAAVGDRDLAWIDDDLWSDAQRWADARSAQTLLVPIAADVGFTRRHFKRLLRFVGQD